MLTPARSGLARSGATRSGYPIPVGAPAKLYALSNVARSGATRSNYTSGRVFVAIDGVPIGTGPAPVLISRYREAVLADGAIAYWRLGETSGTSAFSEVGGYTGTISGGVTLNQPGALADGNPAMAFDGSSGYIDAGNITALNFGAASFTLEAWIKIGTGARYHVVVSKGAAEVGWRGFVTASDVLGLAWGTDAQFYPLSSTVLTLGVWHHVMWGYNATAGAVFYAVDGVQEAIPAANHPVTNASNVRIGTHMGGGYLFAGTIDEVATYPTALTAAQITNHYALRTAQPAVIVQPLLPGTPAILTDTLTITDPLDEQPSTASCTMHFGSPEIGDPIAITLGSRNNLRKDFTGTILRCRQYYVDTPQNPHFDLSLIDDTPGLDTRRIYARFTAQTVSAIATALVSTYAPGYGLQIDPAIGAIKVDQISFADRALTDALSQLMRRAGSHWKCAYGKVVVIGPDGGVNPQVLNSVHPSLLDIDVTRDYSQIVTRVLSEGGGGNTMTEVPPGETLLPLDTTFWYEPSGEVTAGDQRLTYSGIDHGGAGSLVGPGAAPAAAPVAQLTGGAGVTVGSHDYAITFVTASGESLPGPRVSIAVTGTLAPPSAPTSPRVDPGSGPNAGTHLYAVSFVTASGETSPGETVSVTTDVQPPPPTAPTTGTPTTGWAMDPGNYDYAVTFVQGGGETTPGPFSPQVTVGGPDPTHPPPTTAPTPGTPTTGGAMEAGTYDYAVTFVYGGDETVPGPFSAPVTLSPPFVIPPSSGGTASLNISTGFGTGNWNIGDTIEFAVTYVTAAGETTVGPLSNAIVIQNNGAGSACWAYLANIPVSSDPAVTGRRAYTRRNGAWAGGVDVPNDRTGIDMFGSYGLGPPPSSNTATKPAPNRVPIANIPVSGAGVNRNLYRRTASQGTRLLASLGASETTFADVYALSTTATRPSPPWFQTVTTGVPFTYLPVYGPGVTRNLYRRTAAQGARLLVSLGDSETTWTDIYALSVTASRPGPPTTNTAPRQEVILANIPVGGSLVTARKIWGTAANAAQLKFVTTLDTLQTAYRVTTPDASLGADAPTANTATAAQVLLSSIPLGAPAVTQRKIYRTAANLTPLKLLATVGDNTTTTITDTVADGSLGAAAPTSDTSGLQQPPGQVLAGSPSVLVAGAGAFRASGGWAVIGNGEQIIRYTAISGGSLTGIPAGGYGAIVATIAYNSTITAAPMLTGIPASGSGAILFLIARGDPVNLLVIENDLPAQIALAELLGTNGIQEDSISDNRLSAAEARARARAWLALRKDVDISVRAVTRDRNNASGRTLTINLGLFQLYGVPFTIQSVTAQAFTPALQPQYHLQASSVRFTFEDWQRMLKEGL